MKKLNLDRSRIRKIISRYHGVVDVGSWRHADNKYKLKVTLDDDVVRLQFYFNDDGTTSVQYGNDDKSQAVLTHLLDHCIVDTRKNISYSSTCSKSDFRSLVKYLVEKKSATLLKSHKTDMYYLKKLTCKQQDTITIKYYTNGTLQLQGKPLYLYAKATTFLDNTT
jgi:hypothetical protein